MHRVMVIGPTRTAAVMVELMRPGVTVRRAAAELRNRIVRAAMMVMRRCDQQHRLQVQRFAGAGYAGRIRQIGVVHLALVHGTLVHRLRLQAHVSCGQNEGERRENAAVHAACEQ